MNARGELLGRLALAVLAGLAAKELLYPTDDAPDWLRQWLALGIFVCGYMFGLAPTVSKWVEEIWGEKDEGRDTHAERDDRGDTER